MPATWSGDPCVLVQCSSELGEAPADSAELSDGMPELGELLPWQWGQRAQVRPRQARYVGSGGHPASRSPCVKQEAIFRQQTDCESCASGLRTPARVTVRLIGGHRAPPPGLGGAHTTLRTDACISTAGRACRKYSSRLDGISSPASSATVLILHSMFVLQLFAGGLTQRARGAA